MAADAIVALALAGLLLGLVYNAAATSQNANRKAWERRLSLAEAQYRLYAEAPMVTVSKPRSGPVVGGGVWSVHARPLTAADGPVALCAVSSEVIDGAHRLRAGLETARFCGQAETP